MKSKLNGEVETIFFPSIRSSVLLRGERTGGYISSPNHGLTDLGSVDLNVARFCNGQNTIGAVAYRIANVEKWPKDTALQATWNALRRFQQIDALEWRMSPSAQAQPLEVPMPLDEDEAILGRALSAPLSVLWDITYACNLKCSHCLTGSGKKLPDELNFYEACGILDQLARAKVFSITFCGGEPLTRPYLFSLIQKATDAGIEVNLDTNGLLIDAATAERLQIAGVKGVQVSIDGREETHDRFRGKQGSFKAAVEAVRILRSAGVFVSISSVLTAATYQDLDYLVDLALKFGASGLKLSMFYPPDGAVKMLGS